MNTFANQVVLITGAGQGIGRQLALHFAEQGAAVAAIDLRAEPLKKLQAELAGKPVAWAVADVTEREALIRTVVELERQLGPTDILVANAGIGIQMPALQFRAAAVEAQVRVNLIGVANSVEAVLPAMLARRRGHLVVISSLASFRGLPILTGYCASKAGVNGLMEGLRVELKDHGIDCTILCPGFIRTPLTASLEGKVPLLDLDVAARRMIQVIQERRPFYAFPLSAAFRSRLLRWLPARLSDWLVARYIKRLTASRTQDVDVPLNDSYD